jgi:hypothetical protein
MQLPSARTIAEEIDALEVPGLPSLASRKPRYMPRLPKGVPVPTEDQVQRSIIALVKRLGGKAVAVENETKQELGRNGMFTRRARGVVAGTCDLFTFWPGNICVPIECKRPGGKVRPEQDGFVDMLTGLGFTAGIVASVDEAEALFRRAGVVR